MAFALYVGLLMIALSIHNAGKRIAEALSSAPESGS